VFSTHTTQALAYLDALSKLANAIEGNSRELQCLFVNLDPVEDSVRNSALHANVDLILAALRSTKLPPSLEAFPQPLPSQAMSEAKLKVRFR
jgi:hypothetical protein